MRSLALLAAISALFLSLLASPLPAQESMEDAKVEAVDLGHGIYLMATGFGGNMAFFAGDDGVILIDDQFAPLSEKILAAIATVSDKPVQFVVNTHFHGDHTGGNENLGKTGSILIAHDNVRARMTTEQFNELFEWKRPPATDGALPVVTFTDEVTFHWNDEEVEVVHVEHVHTDGDAIIHFKTANIIHMGDTFFNEVYPFIDTSAGGTTRGMIAAAERGLALANETTQIIPGHGEMATKAQLQAYRDMLVELSGRVEKAIGEGKSLEEIQGMGLSAEWDEVWNWRFITTELMIKMLYMDLTDE
jgi:glyoxylase-like metal-dependent hydrolase (beta-lactamase superfamily II)